MINLSFYIYELVQKATATIVEIFRRGRYRLLMQGMQNMVMKEIYEELLQNIQDQ